MLGACRVLFVYCIFLDQLSVSSVVNSVLLEQSVKVCRYVVSDDQYAFSTTPTKSGCTKRTKESSILYLWHQGADNCYWLWKYNWSGFTSFYNICSKSTKLLLLDGHSSHFEPNTIKNAEEKGVIINMRLPPILHVNANHLISVYLQL